MSEEGGVSIRRRGRAEIERLVELHRSSGMVVRAEPRSWSIEERSLTTSILLITKGICELDLALAYVALPFLK